MADKFMDKVKFFMGIESVEKEEEVEEETVSKVTENTVKSPSNLSYATSAYKTSNTAASLNTGNVVNMHKTSQMKVVLYQPKEFNDTKAIVDSLKERKPVIINIEDIDSELARKIFDFCSGALYALDGHIQKISRGIFILAPNNVDVMGDITGELTKKGVYPWTNK